MKRTTLFRLLALLCGLALIAAACGDDDDSGDGEEGGAQDDTTTTAPEGEEPSGEVVDLSAFGGGAPSHLDPLLATTVSANQVHGSVYDGLTAIDYSDSANPQVVGQVAESFESNEAGDVWTFNIREGLTFSDGTPVLPSSFKHGWELGACYGGNYSANYTFLEGGQEMIDGAADEISGLVADDEAMTLEVTLAEPFSAFAALVNHGTFSPMPEAREMPEDCDAVNPDDQSDWENPANGLFVGNGPFMLESWEADYSEVVMVPNPEWDGTAYDEALALPAQPYVEKVTFVAADDVDNAYNEFEAGGADLAAIPPGRTSEATENYATLLEEPSLGAYYLQINQRDERVGGPENVLLRRAILQAIDRDDINEVVYEGSRTTATGITPEGIPGWQEGICEICTYDPEAAQADFDAWVAEGNSLDGPIPIQYNDGFGHADVVDIIIENLSAIGIEAEADPRPPETYFDDLANGECVICRAGWLADYPGYHNFMFDLFHSANLDGNNYGYTSDEFDALIDQAKAESDQEASAELYRQAESLLLNEDAAAIPINWYNSTTVYNPDTIAEIYEDPSFHIHWETIRVAE